MSQEAVTVFELVEESDSLNSFIEAFNEASGKNREEAQQEAKEAYRENPSRAKEAYLDNPLRCPICGAQDITRLPGGYTISVSGKCYIETIKCKSCGSKWDDRYKLIGININSYGPKDTESDEQLARTRGLLHLMVDQGTSECSA